MRLENILTGPADFNEIRRYMGYYRLPGAEKQPGESFEIDPENGYGDTDALIRKALELTESKLDNRVLSDCFPLKVYGENLSFGGCELHSADLAKRLTDCTEIVLFAATSGFALDRLIEKYKRTEPSLAYSLSMVGTEHTEALCEEFCRRLETEAAQRQMTATMRYSPGYGDLSLEFQKEIFRILDITKRLGVTLNESLLMTPVKTVTAIVGLKRKA